MNAEVNNLSIIFTLKWNRILLVCNSLGDIQLLQKIWQSDQILNRPNKWQSFHFLLAKNRAKSHPATFQFYAELGDTETTDINIPRMTRKIVTDGQKSTEKCVTRPLHLRLKFFNTILSQSDASSCSFRSWMRSLMLDYRSMICSSVRCSKPGSWVSQLIHATMFLSSTSLPSVTSFAKLAKC